MKTIVSLSRTVSKHCCGFAHFGQMFLHIFVVASVSLIPRFTACLGNRIICQAIVLESCSIPQNIWQVLE